MRIGVLAFLAGCNGSDTGTDDTGDTDEPTGNTPDLELTDLVRVEVEVSAGALQIGGFDSDTLSVRTGGGAEGDTWDYSVDAGVASLWAVCATGERGCGTGFDLIVPNDVQVVASSFEGPVTLIGHEALVQIISNRAPVEVVQRPTSALSVVTQSGTVDISMAEDPTSLDVDTQTGNIAVALPGEDYDMLVSSVLGDVSFEGVRNVGGAPAVRLTSNEGDITVTGSGGG